MASLVSVSGYSNLPTFLIRHVRSWLLATPAKPIEAQ